MLDRQLERANRDAFRQLCRCLKTEHPLALVGAGLPARIGYPSWGGLLDTLHKAAKADRKFSAERLRLIREDDDVLFRAGLYRQHMGNRAYRNLLKKTFGNATHRPIDAALK